MDKEQAAKYNYQQIGVNEHDNQQPGENPALNRYHDLYRIARLQVTTGNIVKVIGIVVGIGSLLIFIPGILAGGIVYLLGILISAQGQMLLVHADSAVHSSPFMTDDEKAKVMSLSFPPAVTQIVDG